MDRSVEKLPFPRDTESKTEFVARFVSSPRLKVNYPKLTPFGRRKMADAHWQEAKLRSEVSIKTSVDEWLLFA